MAINSGVLLIPFVFDKGLRSTVAWVHKDRESAFMNCILKYYEQWSFVVPRFNKRIMSFAALTRTLRLRRRAAYADR